MCVSEDILVYTDFGMWVIYGVHDRGARWFGDCHANISWNICCIRIAIRLIIVIAMMMTVIVRHSLIVHTGHDVTTTVVRFERLDTIGVLICCCCGGGEYFDTIRKCKIVVSVILVVACVGALKWQIWKQQVSIVPRTVILCCFVGVAVAVIVRCFCFGVAISSYWLHSVQQMTQLIISRIFELFPYRIETNKQTDKKY